MKPSKKQIEVLVRLVEFGGYDQYRWRATKNKWYNRYGLKTVDSLVKNKLVIKRGNVLHITAAGKQILVDNPQNLTDLLISSIYKKVSATTDKKLKIFFKVLENLIHKNETILKSYEDDIDNLRYSSCCE